MASSPRARMGAQFSLIRRRKSPVAPVCADDIGGLGDFLPLAIVRLNRGHGVVESPALKGWRTKRVEVPLGNAQRSYPLYP